jgi:cytochrome c oxidase subunit 2
MTFTATSTGTYWGQCAEFCGIAHARMAFVVIVQEPTDYARWIEANRTPAAAAVAGSAARGEQIFVNSSCAGCHTVAGTSAVGTSGPDLTHFGSRGTIAARTLTNDRDNLARWLRDTQDVKPGALMPEIDLSTEEIDQLADYLEGLR